MPLKYVTAMLPALTLKVATNVCVTLASLEMDSCAQVSAIPLKKMAPHNNNLV